MIAQDETKRGKVTASSLFGKYGILFVFIIVCVLLAITAPNFVKPANLLNVFKQVSLVGIMATGMTFVIIAADIDLSVGSVAALAGVLTAGFEVNMGMPLALAIIIALAISVGIGASMGLIITKTKVHAFVVSLGMMTIVRGICFLLTNGYPISGVSESFVKIGGGNVAGVPNLVFYLAAAIIIGYIVLTKTPFGRNVYAVGGNLTATRLAGINVDKVRITNFMISSFCAAMAGILLASRVSSGQPVASQGAELDAIAAVVIGGTSMYGGRGSMLGTLVGALFLGVIQNGLNLLQVSPYYQQIFTGSLIIIAVIIDSIKKED
jgi:ribose/xylose/arabinose/galactoside ABC-type transport system permease subunit